MEEESSAHDHMNAFYQLYFETPVLNANINQNMEELTHGPETTIVSKQPKQVLRDFFKIVLVGDYGVGKSSIVARFCDDFFREVHATTIGIDYKIRTIALPGRPKVKLEIFDTAGLEKFRTVASNCYQDASGVVIVYDVTDENTFANIDNYLRELKYFVPPDAEILLMGNKADLSEEGERRVEFKTADKYSANRGLSLFEVSAKTNLHIEEAFSELAQKMQDKLDVGQFDGTSLQTSSDSIFESGTSGDGSRNFLGCFLCCV